MMIKKLEWDTNFFGIKVGEVCVTDSVDFNLLKNFDLIYIKSEVKLTAIPKEANVSFEEQRVEFIKDLIQENEIIDSNIFSLEQLSSVNIEELYDLAFESGKHSRFKLDKKLNHRFHDLYRSWIDQTVNHNFDTNMFIYVIKNQIVGFITFKIDKVTQAGKVGLIAVNSNFQGKGIGKKLIFATENFCKTISIKSLTIPTQLDNEPACLFYKKIGYNICNILNVKHVWIK
jgi:dTDP-4-amino-4,6-dideoxy-D-galactose acyltransferase